MRENVPDWIDDPNDDNLIINHKFLVSLNPNSVVELWTLGTCETKCRALAEVQPCSAWKL